MRRRPDRGQGKLLAASRFALAVTLTAAGCGGKSAIGASSSASAVGSTSLGSGVATTDKGLVVLGTPQDLYNVEAPDGGASTTVWGLPDDIASKQDDAGFNGPGIAPGGSDAAYVDPDTSAVEVVDNQAPPRQAWPAQGSDGQANFFIPPAWSPDGQDLAFVNGNSTDDPSMGPLSIVRADGSGSRQILDGGVTGLLTWSPDGNEIAFGYRASGQGADEGSIDVVNLLTGSLRKVAEGTPSGLA